MKLQTFLSLVSAMIGLIGVVFVSQGALLKPIDMIRSTTHFSAMAWPSNEIISSLASQKHNTLIGVVYVMIAFAIQVVSLMLIDENVVFLNKRIFAIVLACAFVLILAIILTVINRSLRESDELAMKRFVARDYCDSRFMHRPVERANAKGIEDMSLEYFNIEKETTETSAELIVRIAAYIQWEVPVDIDFSKLNDQEQ